MPAQTYKFGRVVKNIGELVISPDLSPNSQNVDIGTQDAASRRKGYERYNSVAYQGKVAYLVQWDDYDGSKPLLVVCPAGVDRTA